jgi:hypothetical protein
VDTFFDGSPEEAVLALIQLSDTQLPDAVVHRLATRIDQARKEGR